MIFEPNNKLYYNNFVKQKVKLGTNVHIIMLLGMIYII